jgi:hypothetical protein
MRALARFARNAGGGSTLTRGGHRRYVPFAEQRAPGEEEKQQKNERQKQTRFKHRSQIRSA